MPLTFDLYQLLALRTENKQPTQEKRLTNAGLGLAGESGEFADHIKKIYYHGHELDEITLAKELGDVLWYLAIAADAIGLTLEDIATGNILKLQNRYPDGFDQERSINRED